MKKVTKVYNSESGRVRRKRITSGTKRGLSKESRSYLSKLSEGERLALGIKAGFSIIAMGINLYS